jgi:hypothetical protein
LFQVILKLLPDTVSALDHVEVVHRLNVLDFEWGNDPAVLQVFVIERGIPSPSLVPLRKVLQLHTEDGGLESIEPAVHPFHVMVVFFNPSVVREHSCPDRPFVVAGDDRPAVSIGAQVLAGIETEATDIPDRTDSPAFVHGAMGLGRIFHNLQTVLRSDFQNGIHVGRLPVKVNRKDGLRPGGNFFFYFRHIDVVGSGVDVYKDYFGPGHGHGFGGGDETVRHRDHLVPCSDPQGLQREKKRIGSVAHADTVFCSAESGKTLFKGL